MSLSFHESPFYIDLYNHFHHENSILTETILSLNQLEFFLYSLHHPEFSSLYYLHNNFDPEIEFMFEIDNVKLTTVNYEHYHVIVKCEYVDFFFLYVIYLNESILTKTNFFVYESDDISVNIIENVNVVCEFQYDLCSGVISQIIEEINILIRQPTHFISVPESVSIPETVPESVSIPETVPLPVSATPPSQSVSATPPSQSVQIPEPVQLSEPTEINKIIEPTEINKTTEPTEINKIIEPTEINKIIEPTEINKIIEQPEEFPYSDWKLYYNTDTQNEHWTIELEIENQKNQKSEEIFKTFKIMKIIDFDTKQMKNVKLNSIVLYEHIIFEDVNSSDVKKLSIGRFPFDNGVAGEIHMYNICYMNTFIQIIFSMEEICEIIVDFFQKHEDEKNIVIKIMQSIDIEEENLYNYVRLYDMFYILYTMICVMIKYNETGVNLEKEKLENIMEKLHENFAISQTIYATGETIYGHYTSGNIIGGDSETWIYFYDLELFIKSITSGFELNEIDREFKFFFQEYYTHIHCDTCENIFPQNENSVTFEKYDTNTEYDLYTTEAVVDYQCVICDKETTAVFLNYYDKPNSEYYVEYLSREKCENDGTRVTIPYEEDMKIKKTIIEKFGQEKLIELQNQEFAIKYTQCKYNLIAIHVISPNHHHVIVLSGENWIECNDSRITHNVNVDEKIDEIGYLNYSYNVIYVEDDNTNTDIKNNTQEIPEF